MSLSKNPYKAIAKTAFASMIGFFMAMALIGVASFIVFMLGWTIIMKYNKPGTKPLEDIQPMQYLGIMICAMACAPYLQYFFQGLLFTGGGNIGGDLF
jgi:hypothetical protein